MRSAAIAGGGPAGLMLGTLLARQGLEVTVLEKHADFLRDFRGDTVHPSTLELMHELGWAEEFLRLPHSKMDRVTVDSGQGLLTIADFRSLPVRSPYIAFLPQWDFLDFLARKAAGYPGFRLLRRTEATGLVVSGGKVTGIRAVGPDGELDVSADLVVAADGRHSALRHAAGLTTAASSPSIDVLWFRVSRHEGETAPFFKSGRGAAIVAIDRGDFWQIAYTLPKGRFDEIKAAGLDAFRDRIVELMPGFQDRMDEIDGFGDAAAGGGGNVKLLSVQVDRLRRWYRPGLLFIGDAAHAMSPAGGVGINLAIQDAVATANIVGPALRDGRLTSATLRRVQRRRAIPTALTQAYQLRILKSLYPKNLNDDASARRPLFFRLLQAVPPLRHLTGRFIGIGIRPEHIAADTPSLTGERSP